MYFSVRFLQWLSSSFYKNNLQKVSQVRLNSISDIVTDINNNSKGYCTLQYPFFVVKSNKSNQSKGEIEYEKTLITWWRL